MEKYSHHDEERPKAALAALLALGLASCSGQNKKPDAYVEPPDLGGDTGDSQPAVDTQFTDDTQGVSTECFIAIQDFRDALDSLKLMSDTEDVDNNRGPFVAVLDMQTCASGLIKAAEDAGENLEDKCKSQKPLIEILERIGLLVADRMCTLGDENWHEPVRDTGPVVEPIYGYSMPATKNHHRRKSKRHR